MDTIKSGTVQKRKLKVKTLTLRADKTVNPAVKAAAKNTHHLRSLTVFETDKFVLPDRPSDSLTAVSLINFNTGEILSVYPYSPADTNRQEVAAVKFSGRYIDMFSASPQSFYSISAAGKAYYGIKLFTTVENLSLKSIENNIVSMDVPAFSRDLDTMKAPVRERIPDSLRARVLIVKLKERINVMGMDSLKLLVKKYSNDTLKATIFSEIASRYMDYDTISNKRKRLSYQNNAVTYSTLAMQQYYKGSDSLGMRSNFDNMAKVYYAQKKFSQAKWFILQSNSLSRGKNDIPNIIQSLITLAAIKSEINDYTLAMRDLNEAMGLSVKFKYPKYESEVLENYGLLYSRLKNYPKEELVLKKRDSVEAEIHKKEQDSLLAKVVTADSLQNRKIDSVQVKKKVYTSNTRKQSKSGSVKKIVSL